MSLTSLGFLVALCTANTDPLTMASEILVESGGHAYAIHDNTSGRSYLPASYDAAVVLAEQLLAQGHLIDVGLGQIDSGNFASLHLDVRTALLPCDNLWAADLVLHRAWCDLLIDDGPAIADHPMAVIWQVPGIYHSGHRIDPVYERAVLAQAAGAQAQKLAAIARAARARGVHAIVPQRPCHRKGW